MLLDKLALDVVELASTDETRPSINAVHITPDYTEATNGHILARVPVCKTLDEDFPVVPDYEGGNLPDPDGVVLPADTVKAIAKRIPKGRRCSLPILCNASIRFNGSKTVKVATTDLESPLVSTVRLSQDRYPNTGQLWKSAEKGFKGFIAQVSYSPNELANLAIFLNRAGVKQVEFCITGEETATEFKGTTEDGREIVGLLMPVRNPNTQ